MKTIECKLYLNTVQQQSIDQWLDVQRWVWNSGLAMLKEFEKFATYNKHDKAYAPCCPVPWEYRYVPLNEETEWRDRSIIESLPVNDKLRTTYLPIPYCESGHGKIGKFRQHCPRPQGYVKPRIDRDSEYSLTPKFAHKLHPDKPWFKACPYKLTQGTIKLLATSWQEYKKGKRKSPKFKRRGGNKTLNNTQSGNAKFIDPQCIKLPKLGKVKVRGLEGRWPEDLQIKSYRILKKSSGYYLMLVGKIKDEAKVQHPDQCVGIDPGVAVGVACSDRRTYHFPRYYQDSQKRLRRLQRKLSWQIKGSSNYRKTLAKIKLLHERIAKQRKLRNHEISSIITKRYGAIALEENAIKNMVKRPKPKLRKVGKGYESNKAKQKTGLNKSLLNVGMGQFKLMLQAKTKALGTELKLTPSHYNSQTCNKCGTVDANSRKSQSEFVCTACGHSENADINAAKNVVIRSELTQRYKMGMRGTMDMQKASKRRYPAFAGKLKPVKDSSLLAMGSEQQESAQAEPLELTRESSPAGQLRGKNKRKGRRSAQVKTRNYVQLEFWVADLEVNSNFF
ncbi:MAG: type V CRISPR-associated protein C2c8 [Cyanobacteria bacterium P01_F01_bin.150]